MFSPDRHSYRVHRIIYETFIGHIPEDKVVCHKNDNECDNSVDNLYLGTIKENTIDAFNNKKRKVGEKCTYSKLTEVDVLEVRKMYPEKSYKELSQLFNVSKSTICDIIKYRTWKHLKGEK